MWLAWVAESPAKAQTYLKNVVDDPRFSQTALGGLQWLSLLTGDSLPAGTTTANPWPPVSLNPTNHSRPADGPTTDETVVNCPSCEAILYVRSSAIGRPRLCPACDARFQVELDQSGAVNARVLAKTPTSEKPSDIEVASPISSQTAIVNGNGDTILVVDDSPTIRRIASMILNKNGYRVLTANSGEEGLTVAQNDLPQLILLDINMPGIGGYETCKRLRANKATHYIPVVMLSGKDGLFDQVKGYQAGSSKYLTKPCDARAMLTAVRQLLSRPVTMTS